MEKSYGSIIIKKNSVLYHTSDTKFGIIRSEVRDDDFEVFQDRNDKPMLFCTFHPSEYDVTNEYVTFIKLKKDISVLFMIESFKKAKIYSSLNLFTNHPNLNLAKKQNDQLSSYVQELKKANFDGWITSIENKMAIEVSLINDINVYEIIKTEKLSRNWRNGNSNEEGKTLKKGGEKYPICSIKRPVILYLNSRFKKMIEDYQEYEKKSNYLKEYAFQVLLYNAIIMMEI
jgi:hypothetical protein